MKENQVIEKTEEMLLDAIPAIKREVKRLMKSGAINVGDYGDNYRLPKLLLTVSMENVASEYSPLTIEGKMEANNLRFF